MDKHIVFTASGVENVTNRRFSSLDETHMVEVDVDGDVDGVYERRPKPKPTKL